MTITDYLKTKNGLKALYDAANQELLQVKGWESYSGSWRLIHVGIHNNGELTAVVSWFKGEHQWVGLSWENVTNRLLINGGNE